MTQQHPGTFFNHPAAESSALLATRSSSCVPSLKSHCPSSCLNGTWLYLMCPDSHQWIISQIRTEMNAQRLLFCAGVPSGGGDSIQQRFYIWSFIFRRVTTIINNRVCSLVTILLFALRKCEMDQQLHHPATLTMRKIFFWLHFFKKGRGFLQRRKAEHISASSAENIYDSIP